MVNKEILERAIQKAIDAGYNLPYTAKHFALFEYDVQLFDEDKEFITETHYTYFIFSHDFAKALWGELAVDIDEGCAIDTRGTEKVEISKYWRNHHLNSWNYHMPRWAYHLTKMVVADDPIKYLGENI